MNPDSLTQPKPSTDIPEVHTVNPKPSSSHTILVLAIVMLLLASSALVIFKVLPQKNDVKQNPNSSSISTNLNQKLTLKKFSDATEFKKYITDSQSASGFGSVELISMQAAPAMSESIDTRFNALRSIGSADSSDRYSQTNVQVVGVDEPDIVKNNGSHIFYSSENYYLYGIRPLTTSSDMVMIAPRRPGGPVLPQPTAVPQNLTKIISAFPLEGLSITGGLPVNGDLLLHKNILVVLTPNSLIGYDVTSPGNPVSKWTINYGENQNKVTARMLDGVIYVVTSKSLDYARPCPVTPLKGIEIACTEILHPSLPVSTNTVYSIISINSQTGSIISKSAITGNYNSTIYMSYDNLYIAYNRTVSMFDYMFDFLKTSAADLVDAQTLSRIDKLSTYDISTQSKLIEIQSILETYSSSLTSEEKSKMESDMQNRMKEYLKRNMRDLEKTDIARINLKNFGQTAVGTLPGHLLNQFSLDEHQNNLRAAVTISTRNFGGSNTDSTNEVYVLSPSMEITGKISNLGDAERIYSVRFLSDRGFVVTFRETDPFYVLDLSDPKNPKAKGELKIPGYSSYLHPLSTNRILGVGKEESQVKLSLFDVSDAANPVEVSKYVLDEYWSEALNNHRAFMYDGKYGLIFIPASKGGYIITHKDGQLALGKVVDIQNTKRALFIGENLYVLGDTGLKVISESTLETLKSLTF